jgi:hypothetical protein
MEEAQQVRRCRACGATAVLPGTAWRHTHFGVRSEIYTREYRCQECGKGFSIRPRARLIGYLIAGILLLPTCVGVPVLIMAWWMWKQDAWNPVVPGATPVARRFPVGPLPRRCAACSNTAVPTQITRHVHNGVPMGTDVVFTCKGCGATFTIESPWGQLVSVASASLVGGLAAAFFFVAESPGWRFGGAGVCALVAVLMLAQAVKRVLARIRNPPLGGPAVSGSAPGASRTGSARPGR